MNPHDYCRRRTSASGSSFYYGFLCLPTQRRRAIMALYAFCREIDDVVDETSDTELARSQLEEWRAEVARVYAGTPQHPVGQALADIVAEFRLPQEQLLEIIDGMEMDLEQSRYADFSQLQLYCYRVASVVGLLSAEIFGYTDRHTLRYAHDLGMAFQLTNILRDVGDDARRGRIYLPQDELARFGVSEDDILAGRYTPQMTELLAFQAQRAQEFYERALGELPDADRRAQRPGLIMAAVYRRLLDEIVAGGYRVLGDPPRLATALKLKLATNAFWQNRK